MTRKISQRIDINYQNTLIVTKFRARNSHKTIKSYTSNFQKQFINSSCYRLSRSSTHHLRSSIGETIRKQRKSTRASHSSVRHIFSRMSRMIQRNSVYYSCARNPENRFDRWRTGSTVFDDPIPRSDFHAHAVVRARYACIPSSTMPAIRYSRNEILCLFCAMKKKEGE